MVAGRLFGLYLAVFVLVPCLKLVREQPFLAGMTMGLALLTTGVYTGVSLWRSELKQQISVNWVLGILLALMGVMLLSVWGNPYGQPAAWHWYLVYFSFSALLLLAAGDAFHQLGETGYVELLTRWLWRGVMIYALFSLARYYGVLAWLFPSVPTFIPSSILTKLRMGGMLAQANLNTSLLWLGLLAACFHLNKPGARKWLVISVVVFGWGIACSASRISWLYAGALLLLAFFSWLPRWRLAEASSMRKRLVVVSLVMVAMLLGVPLVNKPLNQWLTSQGMVNRVQPDSLVGRSDFDDHRRFSEWSKALEALPAMSTKQLLMGVGPGHYAHFSEQNMHLTPTPLLSALLYDNAHNIFVRMFVEMGLLGLIILVLFIALMIWQALKYSMSRERLFLIGAVGLLFIHCNTEYPLWFAWFMMLWWLLLLPLGKLRQFRLESRWVKPGMGIAWLVLTLGLTLTVGVHGVQIITMSRSDSLDQRDYQRLLLMRNDSLLGPYATRLRYKRFGPASEGLDWQLQEAKQMQDWLPTPLVRSRYYFLLVMTGRLDEACKEGRIAGWRFPSAAPYMVYQVNKYLLDDKSKQRSLEACIEQGLEQRGTSFSAEKKKAEDKLGISLGEYDKSVPPSKN